MSHVIESCDVLDVLEEAVTLKSAVIVDLRGGGQFTDQVRDVVTEDGENRAVFADHGTMPLHAIANARRALPREDRYTARLTHGPG